MGGACISRHDFEQHLQQVCHQSPIIWQKGLLLPDILS